jgi:hypothetical protein
VNMPKPTEADKDAFGALVPDDPRVEVKPMFGNLGAFVNGNMFMGLLGSSIGVKLPEAERAKAEALAGAGPFGPEGRPMGGYVALPPSSAGPWVAKALDYVGSLPPKVNRRK